MTAAPLVVTELMYHPRISAAEEQAGFVEDDFEFIEVQNIGTEVGTLADAQLGDGVTFAFPKMALAPGQQAVIARNPAALQFRYGSEPLVLGEFQGNLSNSGERLTVVSQSGQKVLSFEYKDSWHPATDGSGFSLTIINPLANSSAWGVASGWTTSRTVGGSPGSADDGNPPGYLSAPRSLTATPRSVRHVELRWNAPSSSTTQITGYRIYRDGQLIGSSNALLFLDDSVGPGQQYVYQVAAVDVAGKDLSLSSPAAVVMEPLGGATAFGTGASQGQVTASELSELSGMVASRSYPGMLWTANDQRGTDTIYLINEQADFAGSVVLFGSQLLDTEDLAVGPRAGMNGTFVFVGDIGDNVASRADVLVYTFAESFAQNASVDEPVFLGPFDYDYFVLTYPDGPRDAESMVVDPLTGDLLIVTKEVTESRIYRAPAAKLIHSETVTLEYMGLAELHEPSAADISPDGLEILLRNEDKALVYVRHADESVAQALQRPGQAAPVIGRPVEPNGETIAYDANNRGYFTISEGFDSLLYFFPRLGPAAAGDANRDGLFNSSDLVAVFQRGKYETGLPALWEEGDWNGDGQFSSADLLRAFQLGGYESPAARPASLADVIEAPATSSSHSSSLESAAVDWLLSGLLDKEDKTGLR